MPSIPKPPGSATLRALLDKHGAFLQSQGVDLAAELVEPRGDTRNNACCAVEAPSTAPSSPVADVIDKLQRATSRRQRRAERKASGQRLGHKYGARAKQKKRSGWERARRAAQRHARRFAQRTEPWQAAAAAMPRRIPREAWLIAWDCAADATATALLGHMRREPNKAALGAAARAALGRDDFDRDELRCWTDETARKHMTLALFMLKCAAPSARPGPRWGGGILRGIGVRAFAAALVPPDCGARSPHRNTLRGRHRGAGSDRRRGQVGYLRALELAGFCYGEKQAKAADAEPFEVGPSGYTYKRWRIVSATPPRSAPEGLRELLIALHRAGRLAVLRRPRPVKKPAVYRAQQPAPADPAPS